MFQFLKHCDDVSEDYKKRLMKDNAVFAGAIWRTCTAINNLPLCVSNHISDMIAVMFPELLLLKTFSANKTKHHMPFLMDLRMT